jgi:hypothetical protein
MKLGELESQIKNINFKADLHASIEYDIHRQRSLTMNKKHVCQEIQTEEILMVDPNPKSNSDKNISSDNENHRNQAIQGRELPNNKAPDRVDASSTN